MTHKAGHLGFNEIFSLPNLNGKTIRKGWEDRGIGNVVIMNNSDRFPIPCSFLPCPISILN